MGDPADDMEARALKLGAVALVRLRKPDLAAAVAEHPSDRSVGTIVRFPARPSAAPPTPAGYEDPRWAERHRPD